MNAVRVRPPHFIVSVLRERESEKERERMKERMKTWHVDVRLVYASLPPRLVHTNACTFEQEKGGLEYRGKERWKSLVLLKAAVDGN